MEYKDRNRKQLSKKETEYESDLESALAGIANIEATGQLRGSLPSGEDMWDNGNEI